MTVKFSNNASATLATSINSTVTTLQVSSGEGAKFPSLGYGEYFFATLIDSSNNIEIVKVTARASDTFTIVRGQDGSTQRPYVAGSKVDCRVTAAGLAAIYTDAKNYTDAAAGQALNDHLSDTTAAHAASAISVSPTGGIEATTVQAALAELDNEKVAKTTPVTAGAGIGISGTIGGLTLTNTGVTKATGSAGISVSAQTGEVTFSPTAGYNGHGARTVSTSEPSGGVDGDIWYQY